jgi:hypothetical protein
MIQCPCGIARADCTYHKPEEPQSAPSRIPSGGRGSGRTTRQLQALPKGAWFFCSSYAHGAHIATLAKKIGRSDITMKVIDQLRDYYQFHGCVISGFDIDHYAQEQGLDSEILDGAGKLRSCVKPWPKPKS